MKTAMLWLARGSSSSRWASLPSVVKYRSLSMGKDLVDAGEPPERAPDLETAFPLSLFRSKLAQGKFLEYCRKENVQYSYNASYLLHRLAKADISTIGPEYLRLRAVTVRGDPVVLGDRPFGFPLAPNTLFKRDFYDSFSNEVCKAHNVMIQGSTGSSKSTWQYLYLHSLLTGGLLRR
jgi:hypothetical protein